MNRVYVLCGAWSRHQIIERTCFDAVDPMVHLSAGDQPGGHRVTTPGHTIEPTSTRTQPMRDGRHAASARGRQRVLAALDRRTAEGAQISVSAIARAAGVDRSFLYRHRDLREKIHVLAAEPPVAT